MKKRILFIGDSITDAGRDRAEATDLGKGLSTFDCRKTNLPISNDGI